MKRIKTTDKLIQFFEKYIYMIKQCYLKVLKKRLKYGKSTLKILQDPLLMPTLTVNIKTLLAAVVIVYLDFFNTFVKKSK